jgi:hypothetical protein
LYKGAGILISSSLFIVIAMISPLQKVYHYDI